LSTKEWARLSAEITEVLGLEVAPIGITFSAEAPPGVPRFDEPMSEATPDGRRGRVAASCVFWMRGTERNFTTVPEDHGNCSVGTLTHGLAGLRDVASKADVGELLDSGWISMDTIPSIPTVSEPASFITYGPLDDFPLYPEVVFLRINPEQLMVLTDALGDIDIGGKPQCHIVASAKERGRVAVSFGCMLSRVRTGMSSDEMTCAIPGDRLGEVVEALTRAQSIDDTVASYASKDAARFMPRPDAPPAMTR
jgi:uncharacterized protein (DUF169 family)